MRYCMICGEGILNDPIDCDCCEGACHIGECKDRHDFIVKAHTYLAKVAINNTTSAQVSCRICGRDASCSTDHGESIF